ncbi:MAG: cupredoxin domain-containing protein [Solirubrobacterales bacterium]
MQGLTVVVSGFVFLSCLAAPGVLFASTGTDVAPPGESPGVPPPAGEQAAGPDPDPAATPPEPEVSTNEVAQPADTRPGRGRGGGARAAAARTVAMRDGNRFVPRRIEIDVGDVVRWENESSVAHDAIGEDGSFETPIIDEGETSEHSFDDAGRHPYFCSIHQGMTGTIQVGSSSGGGGGGGGGSGSGGPSSGSGGTAAPGGSTGSTGGTSGTGGFGSTGSSGTGSSLPATGSELLWLGLLGYGLLAIGALARLGAIGR